MIVIKSIEYIEVDKDTVQLAYSSNPDQFMNIGGATEDYMEARAIVELVRGRRFVLPSGKEMCVGMSKQAADILGMHCEVWDRMENALSDTSNRLWKAEYCLRQCDEVLQKFISMNFWGKLKWAFVSMNKT